MNTNDEGRWYRMMLKELFPFVRQCSPKAYFRAKLVDIIRHGPIFYSATEVADRRMSTIAELVGSFGGMNTRRNIFVLVEICAIITSCVMVGAGKVRMMISLIPLELICLWASWGIHRHLFWLRGITKSDRLEIIDYLCSCEFLSSEEAIRLEKELQMLKTRDG